MAPGQQSDEIVELVTRIASGDRGAEAQLVERFAPGLMVLLRRRLRSPASRGDVEDLCQEALQVALRALRAGQLRDPERLAAYLAGIARRVRLPGPRLFWRRTVPMDELPDFPDLAHRSAERQAMASEEARLVRAALLQLGERDREVLSRYYLEDEAKERLCEELGLTSSQFDVVKHRALKRIARAYDDVARRSRRETVPDASGS
jgi:RNA polymerase sigma-70 factor, ECF subfamily